MLKAVWGDGSCRHFTRGGGMGSVVGLPGASGVPSATSCTASADAMCRQPLFYHTPGVMPGDGLSSGGFEAIAVMGFERDRSSVFGRPSCTRAFAYES